MVATNKQEKVLIGDGQEVIELTGAEKEAFLADRDARETERLLLETEYKAKQEARDSAIKKLGEIAGLTEEEINAIL